MVSSRGIITALAVLTLCSCVNQEPVLRKQAELESRLESLAQGHITAKQQISDLSNQVMSLQEQSKSNAEELRNLQNECSYLRAERTRLLAQKISGTAKSVPQKIELINKEEAGNVQQKRDVQSEAYMKAFGLYSANRFNEAVAAFTLFLKTYPDSEFAANAQYWIGECYYTTSNLPKALDAFDKVIANYPAGSKVPDAMLKAGFTLFALKQNDRAVAILESLVAKYPGSPAAAKARERLNQR